MVLESQQVKKKGTAFVVMELTFLNKLEKQDPEL